MVESIFQETCPFLLSYKIYFSFKFLVLLIYLSVCPFSPLALGLKDYLPASHKF